MKLTRRQLRKLIIETIDDDSINFDDYIDENMDFEGLVNQINLLLNATADPETWKQVDHANTEVFIFIEPTSDVPAIDDEDWEPWYIPWHNLKDAFLYAGIPNYHDMSLFRQRNFRGVAWYAEIKKSRMEGGTKIPQINIFHLVRGS